MLSPVRISMGHSFYALSVELIVEILNYLDYHDLLKCCQVSKRVQDIILNTSSLQYKVQLGLTGNVDGHGSSSLPERLARVRRFQSTWENPRPTFVDSFTIPSQSWSHSKWQKDVFLGRHPSSADNKRLEIFNISSAFTGKGRLQDISFDVAFDAYSVDFDQDLIALVRNTDSDNNGRKIPPRVYLRSFKNQTPHPRARRSTFDLALYGFRRVAWMLRARLQIAGDYLLLVLFRSLPVESIVVWHWPTGAVKNFEYFSQDDGCINAMCTDCGHLLIAKRLAQSLGRFEIFVYALAGDTIHLSAIFELPRLRWDFRAWLTASFFPREHTCGALHGGLYGSKTDFAPASVLVQFQWDRQYTLYTPLVTFLSPEVLAIGRDRLAAFRFPWKSWGPRSTRIFMEGNTIADICGYRAIFPDHILDFSPATLRNAVADAETDATIIREPGTIAGPMFAEPVVTSLPYRKISLKLPPTSKTVNTRSQLYRAFVDVDGPKLLRVTCGDFILVPSSVEVFSLTEPEEQVKRSGSDSGTNSPRTS